MRLRTAITRPVGIWVLVPALLAWANVDGMVWYIKALKSFNGKCGKRFGGDYLARYGRKAGAGIEAITNLDELALGGKVFQGAADLVVTTEILEVTAQEHVGPLARNAAADPLLQRLRP